MASIFKVLPSYLVGVCLLGCSYAPSIIRDCLDCKLPIALDDENLIKAVNFATDDINRVSHSALRYVYTNISNATFEVMSGWIYNMNLTLQQSSCKNINGNMGKTIRDCPVQSQSRNEFEVCHVSVWDQPWRQPRYLMNDETCSKHL